MLGNETKGKHNRLVENCNIFKTLQHICLHLKWKSGCCESIALRSQVQKLGQYIALFLVFCEAVSLPYLPSGHPLHCSILFWSLLQVWNFRRSRILELEQFSELKKLLMTTVNYQIKLCILGFQLLIFYLLIR